MDSNAANDGAGREDAGAKTREGREKQIAAMTASLDAAPAYRQYRAGPDDGDGDNGGVDDTDGGGGENEAPRKRLRPTNGGESNPSSSPSRDDDVLLLPVSRSILLSSGSDRYTSSDGTGGSVSSTSSVSALSFDPPGSRLAVGHRDGTI